jgi:hypothetical protein
VWVAQPTSYSFLLTYDGEIYRLSSGLKLKTKIFKVSL